MDVKIGGDQLDAATQRQVLVGFAVAAALVVWRMAAATSVK